MEVTTMVLAQLVGQAPGFLVFLAGIGAAIIHYGRAPSAAQLVIAGCATCIVTRIVSTVAFAWITSSRGDRSMADIGAATSLVGGVTSLVGAVGVGLIIVAAFTGRPPREAGAPPAR
jgi:hypothetical protein